MSGPKLHETHVCRDCGAEITIPYVKPAEARADALDMDALTRALLNGIVPARHWLDTETTTKNFARWLAAEYDRQRAKRQQDAATDEAEQEWAKPLPKVL